MAPLPLPGLHCSVGTEHPHLAHHLHHLSAIGSRVHGHAAAQASGNAVGKFQPRQALLGSLGGQLGEKNTGLRGEFFPADLAAGILRHRFHHKGVHPTVIHQQIGAVSHHHRGNLPRPGQLYRFYQLLCLPGTGHECGRTAHPKGGMAAHGLVQSQLQLRQLLAQLSVQIMYLIHMQTLRLVLRNLYSVIKTRVYYTRLPRKIKVSFAWNVRGALTCNAPLQFAYP